jgi:hypothetical protein
MFSIFKWIRECFNYYIFGQMAPVMIAKINDEKNNIAQDVKENLIASIMQNNPAKLIEQINDEKNALPVELKQDLMASIMISKMPPPEYEMPIYPEMNPEEVIHTGKIIPSDQFKPVTRHYYSMVWRKPVVYQLDWHREIKRIAEHFQLRQFIRVRRAQIAEERDAYKQIYTSKIIPSGQFHPKPAVHFTTPVHPFVPIEPARDWYRDVQRVLAHFRLRRHIKNCRRQFKLAQKEKFNTVLNELTDKYSNQVFYVQNNQYDFEDVVERYEAPHQGKRKITIERNNKYAHMSAKVYPVANNKIIKRNFIKLDNKWNQHY